MKNKTFSILVAFAMIFILSSISALAYGNTTIQTVNGSEFNTTTPALQITCLATDFDTSTFNVSIYSVNNTFNNTFNTFLVANTTTVANGTSSYITLNPIVAPAEYLYKVDCFNGTASGTDTIGNVSRNNSIFYFSVNQQPTISSVTSTDGFIPRNNPITFTVTWTDLNKTIRGGNNGTTATDANTIYICNSNSFDSNSGCGGTQLCTSNLTGQETGGSSQCVYTVGLTETQGTKTVYAFSKDNNNYVSSSSSVTYKVAGSGNTLYNQETGNYETASVATSTTTTANGKSGGSSTLVIVIIIVVAIVGYFAYENNKKK